MMRKRFEVGFKARVALEAVKGEKTLSGMECGYYICPAHSGICIFDGNNRLV